MTIQKPRASLSLPLTSRRCRAQELAELDVAPDPQWGERPMQMIRAASRGAMIRAHGQRKDFGVEYSSTKRIQVGAGELVAWEFRERSAGGPHTVDFKLEFVEPGMQPGVSALSSTLSKRALSLSLSLRFCFCSAPGYARCPRVPSL